ncbi:MAG: helix-turn-helix domain-containing protein [Bacilli bacterium]
MYIDGRRCQLMNKKDENYVYFLVGQNLKKQRKFKNFTITKLAMECNYSEGFIMNIESPNYRQTFSLGTIWKFSEVLKIDVRDLFEPLDE